ncbi:hypothetical protein [Falsiroseomonas sp.]|uniref:hypothetical protein n=1 Tax=Falsiroseomonas sp. TaxID=2870721 RepID=UPI0027199BA6|nr:hypothetical protein [Falsiroseomonas sp.]MDO9503710.1 hypothetical protein [Falsiroseomonas sp.]
MSIPLIAGLLLAGIPVAEAETRGRDTIYRLQEEYRARDQNLERERQDRDRVLRRYDDKIGESRRLQQDDMQRQLERNRRSEEIRRGSDRPSIPSPLEDSGRRLQDQQMLQDRLDRRDRFERQRLLMER